MEHRREGSGAGATAWRRAVTHVHFPIVSRPILILQEEREVDKSEKKEKWDELANKKMMGKTEMTGRRGPETNRTTGRRTIYLRTAQ